MNSTDTTPSEMPTEEDAPALPQKPVSIGDLSDGELANLVENRWQSSDSVWDIVKKTYDQNVRYYKNEPEWLKTLPRKQPKVRASRIFVDMEAVINSLIANPPAPNALPSRDDDESKEVAHTIEKYLNIKYQQRNVKETLRKGLRNLYLSRLIVLKPFWDTKIDDFNVRSIDPKDLRIGEYATKEDDSEFAIEMVSDYALALMRRFPNKADEIMKKAGFTSEKDLMIANPKVKYKEAWIRDYVIFKYGGIILDKIPNPYWDWEGIKVTPDEQEQIATTTGDNRRNLMATIKSQQSQRQMPAQPPMPPEAPQMAPEPGQMPQGAPMAPDQTIPTPGDNAPAEPDETEAPLPPLTGDAPLTDFQDTAESYETYFYNHFDHPRKPYIVATVLNNENSPIGQTDFISQAIPLQDAVDERRRDIARNARFVNGLMKIDSKVMTKEEATNLDTEASGKIWGDGVQNGVTRETGTPLPAFVLEELTNNLNEIDNIMAATSAFRGERDGSETKAGRLSLVDQSYLRLNELVQVVDYASFELFNWWYQLMKTRYTERHFAKILGNEAASESVDLIQDDFQDGDEIRIIGGKSLPEDTQTKFQMAQTDVAAGRISPVDYFEMAGYDDPKTLAKNAFKYRVNPADALGFTPDEMKMLQPLPIPDTPNIRIQFDLLPPDAQAQVLQKIGVMADPQGLIAEKMMAHAKGLPPSNGNTPQNTAPVPAPNSAPPVLPSQ